MEDNTPNSELFEVLRKKAILKQEVYQNTLATFKLLKSVVMDMVAAYHQKYNGNEPVIPFEFYDKSEFELELKFGGDVLIFMMHTYNRKIEK